MNPPAIEFRIARPDDAATIGNLMQLYLHDLSAYGRWPIGGDGRFAYPRLPLYWSEEGKAEGRAPFIFFAEGELAGFALRNGHSRLGHPEPVSSVAEFFVLRRWRGQGVGGVAARALFDPVAGAWEVAQLRRNVPARAFWLNVIADYTQQRFVEHDLANARWDGFVQSFHVPGGDPPRA